MLTALSDIAISTISAVLGALIVAAIPIGTRPSLWTGSSRTSVRNSNGQQVYAPNSTGPINPTQHNVVLTTHQTIHQNIQSSATSIGTTQTAPDNRPWAVVLGLAMFTLTAVYSRGYEAAVGFAIGVSIALAAILVVLIYRTYKAELFAAQSLAASARILSGIVLLLAASWSALGRTWGGYSMADVRTHLEELTEPTALDAGVVPWAGSRTTVPAFKMFFSEPQLALVGTFALGAMIFALIWAWSAVSTAFAWSSYLGFQHGATTKKRVIARASEFEALDTRFAWSSLGVTVLFATVIFGFPWLMTMSFTGELSQWLFGQ